MLNSAGDSPTKRRSMGEFDALDFKLNMGEDMLLNSKRPSRFGTEHAFENIEDFEDPFLDQIPENDDVDKVIND